MKRMIMTVGATVLVAVPAATGLIGNTSFSQSVPVRVPSHALIVEYHGGQATSTRLPGDDHGGQRAARTPEPGENHGAQGAAGRAAHPAGGDHPVTSTTDPGSANASGRAVQKATVSGSGSGTDDHGGNGQNGSKTSAGTDGSGHK
jgi:hypothetical protein